MGAVKLPYLKYVHKSFSIKTTMNFFFEFCFNKFTSQVTNENRKLLVSTNLTTVTVTGLLHLVDVRLYIIMPPPLRYGALSDDARVTSVCMTSVCRVHGAKVENRKA